MTWPERVPLRRQALAATVELQLNTIFETTVFEKAVDIPTQYYPFYDWGETWQNRSTAHNAMVNSADVGARAGVTRYIEVDFEGLARCNTLQPVPKRRNNPGPGISPLYDGTFYWWVLTRL